MAPAYLALSVLLCSRSTHSACQGLAPPGENQAVIAASDEAKKSKEADVLKEIERMVQSGKVYNQAYKKAVATFKGMGEQAVPPLVRLLTTSKDENMRLAAALALGELGKGRDAVPGLVRLLTTSKDQSMRLAAVFALQRLGKDAKAAIPQLMQIVKDEKAPPVLRQYSWYALPEIVPDWSAEMPFLIWLLKAGSADPYPILEELGAAANPAIPALIEEVKKDFSSYPTLILGNLGPAAKDAIPVLIQALRADYDHQRQAAAEALGKIGPQTKEVVPALVRGLADSHWWVREAAAQALARIGPAAKDALSALTEALRDEQWEVRRAASDAIQKIKAKPGRCGKG
jgi:HEAT repeat protein